MHLSIRKWLTIPTFAVLGVGFFRPAPARSATDIHPPDQLGPYKIGFAEGVVSPADLPSDDGLPTRVTIFYPTKDSGPAGQYSAPDIGMTFKSVYGAIRNASVAGGPFPLIIENHPGGSRAELAYVVHNHLKERYASHGFIVLSYMRVTGCANRVRAPGRLVDKMTLANAGDGSLFPGVSFAGKIDLGRVGVRGASGGGPESIALGAGSAAGADSNGPFVADHRFKAMVLAEPDTKELDYPEAERCTPTLGEMQALTTPYAVMEGSPDNAWKSVELFNNTINAKPRIDIHENNVIHFSVGGGGACYTIDQLREWSLTHQAGELVDPFDQPFWIYPPNSVEFLGSLFWNILGCNRFCDNVGVGSIKSLDLDNNGRTDSVEQLPDPLLPLAVTDRLAFLYEISFFKAYLAGDIRYNRYLNRGYANVNNLPVQITTVE